MHCARGGRPRGEEVQVKQPVHESAEDYLKAVLALEREHGYVRAVDVAGRLGVSKASVSKALSKLERQKLVHVVAHDVRLTAEGRTVAERVSERHAFFRALLRAAGVEARRRRRGGVPPRALPVRGLVPEAGNRARRARLRALG